MNIDDLYERTMTARNVGHHRQALLTIEKFAGPAAADALGKKVGAHTHMEEMLDSLSFPGNTRHFKLIYDSTPR